MNLTNEQKEQLARSRAVLKCGKEVQVIDVNERFGVSWTESDPLRFMAIPHKDYWSETFDKYNAELDKNFHFDEKALRFALAGFQLGRPVSMTGPTGAGKSDFFEQFHLRLNWPAIRIQCSDDLDVDYFFGSKGLKNGETKWEDEVLTFARKNDIAVCLDEIDSLRTNVQLALNGYLENKGKLTLCGSSFSGESESTVVATGHQPIWATSNTGGKSQTRPGWFGTTAINKAVLDRFVHIYVDYLPEMVEYNIVNAKCPELDKRLIPHMIQVATIVRNEYKAGELETSLSTRSLIDWGNFISYLSTDEAFQICCYAQVEESDRLNFLQAYETGIGSALKLPDHLMPEGMITSSKALAA